MNRTTKPTSFLVAVMVPVLLAALAPEAVRAQPRKDRVFKGESRVISVEVPVNVVDRDGEPIRDLTIDDFELLDDGKPQKITSFEQIDLEMTTAGSRSLSVDELPSAGRRHFLLFFDISFSTPTAVLKARQAARSFVLDELHPTDLVAVATYTLETGPRLIVTFTPDRAQVAHAIDTLGLTRRARQIDPLRFLVSTPESASDVPEFSTAQNDAPEIQGGLRDAAAEAQRVIVNQLNRSERSFQVSRAASFSRSLGEMARILASVGGRKHVVLFSEGFDNRLLTGRQATERVAGDNVQARDLQSGQTWMVDTDDIYGSTPLQRKVRDMLREFRRADCIIQAVDIGGLRAQGDVVDGNGPINTGQDTLFYLANETGGELFKDANDLGEQLTRVLSRSSVTYLLSFSPENLAPNGRFHRLKVRLKEDIRGARLSHRMGYYAPRPYSELHPLEKDLLASDAIASASVRSDIKMNVLAAPFRANPEWSYVPVIVEVDGKTLLEGHTGKQLNVEIYTYVTDLEGEMLDFFTQQVGLNISRGRSMVENTGLKYYGHLELEPGDYRIRVLVRNADTGRLAVRAIPMTVPDYQDEETVLLPPFFLDDPSRWIMVREEHPPDSGGSVIYPFTINGNPYVPAARPEIGRNETAQFCLVAYNLHPSGVQLNGEVLTASGEPTPGGSLRLVERTTTGIEGFDKLLASFSAENLAAGDYTLKVALIDPMTGRSEIETIPFRVQ